MLQPFDYASFMLKKIVGIASDFSRIDVIADRYFKRSLKSQVRKTRGKGSRKNFNGDTPFPNNKEELNLYLADYFLSHHSGSKILVITKCDTIISNDLSLCNSDYINHCSSEEANPRLKRHTLHYIDKVYKEVVVSTGDTDVLVLLISFCQELKSSTNPIHMHTLWYKVG